MSYQNLPEHLDDLNKIPHFTASQLVRALLIVIAEDSRVKANDFDARVFLCTNCVNRSVAGERMMSFAWPDPNASEEEKLTKHLHRLMYPHRPQSPPPPSVPVAPCTCNAPRDQGRAGAGSESPEDLEYINADMEERPNLPYVDTWNAPSVPYTHAPASVAGSGSGTPAIPDTPATTAPATTALASPTPATPARGPFDPDWDYQVPYIAPVSDSTTWYVVSVGRRVGVFDSSAVASAATDRVPANSRKLFSSRNAAIQSFNELLAMPGIVRAIDME
ncbi:hypothetical protein C8T65DRAFT_741808 [Cerioporus squamosus]|nr:hypothetical protein C8T65DRAFT_741808 [Cerioporus squamosus]